MKILNFNFMIYLCFKALIFDKHKNSEKQKEKIFGEKQDFKLGYLTDKIWLYHPLFKSLK